MKKAYFLLLILCLVVSNTIWAQDEGSETTTGSSYSSLSTEDLDKLLAPIALYPDPLLAQALAASTYPLEIVEAERWLSANQGNTSGIDDQDWDPSVKAVAHYPQVLKMMSDDLDWTQKLGQAFLDQKQDVMNTIQSLRERAKQEGNLKSNDKEKVVVENNYIQIVPAEPDVIYIPEYNPYYVYAGPAFITYGLGFPLGIWCDLGFDWGGFFVVHRHWGHWRDRDRDWDGHGIHRRNDRPWQHNPVRAGAWRNQASHLSSLSKGKFNDITQGHRGWEGGSALSRNVRPSSHAFQGYSNFNDVEGFRDRGIHSMGSFHGGSNLGSSYSGAFGGGFHGGGFGGGFHGGGFGGGFHGGGRR